MKLPKVSDDRLQDLLEMRINGLTLKRIGKVVGLSPERVRYLLKVAVRRFNMKGKIDQILGVRVSKVEGWKI